MPLGRALAKYAGLLERRPLATKAVTSCALLGLGDFATQVLVEHKQQISWRRTAKFSLLGAALVAPSLHVWYGFLGRRFASSVTKRVLLDQFVFAPAFLSVFIFSNSFLDSGLAASAGNKVVKELPSTLAYNWVLWIPYQALNFKFVPLPFQVLANNACALFWNAFLSYSLHQGEEDAATKSVVE